MSATPSRLSRRTLVKTTLAGTAVVMSEGINLDPLVALPRGHSVGDPTSLERFPFYRAEGTHRELGRQHGEQAREHIRAHLEFMCSSMKLSPSEMRSRALRFRSLFDKYCPHLVDEITGLGEGARITFADALATNIRGAMNMVGDGGCTAFVVSRRGTSAGQILIGQNSDMLPTVIDLAYVLHLKPQDKPEALMWTFGGMIGYHGINSRGVGHFANDLGGGPKPRFGMPHYPVKRLMLECETVGAVQEHLKRIPLWANGNYVLCDGRGRILDVEATTDGVQSVGDDGAGFIAHSNHFVCSKYSTDENFKLSAVDSFPRLDRMNQLIRSRLGNLGVNDLKSFLRDRDGDPAGICRYSRTNDLTAHWTRSAITVASVVAEPQQRRLHVAVGNKPTALFVVYSMDAN